MTRKKKGFSLLELIVAMAIIAILSVITYQLIARVQQSSRDSQRTQALQNVSAAMEQAYLSLNSYPTLSITKGTATLTATGATLPSVTLSGPTAEISSSNGNSTPSGTVYCYGQPASNPGASYIIGAKLEGSSTFSYVGPDTTTSDCALDTN